MLNDKVKIQLNLTVRLLFVTVIGLMAFGILMVYSASMSANPDEKYIAFSRHILFVPLAIGALLMATWFPYHKLNWSYLVVALLAVTVVLLVGVLFFGTTVNGAKRWFHIPLGFMELSFQPSELAKLTVILFFAWFLSRARGGEFSWRDTALRKFLPLTLLLGLVCGLIAIQDLGTAVLIATVGACLMLAGGVPWWQMASLLPPAAGALYVMITQHPYRIGRLVTYLDPWKDPQGAGYHIIQSLIAIGSGGWFGLGLGYGIQKLAYLPEDTTDFIFSIICEEMGIVGGILVILMFLCLALLGLRIVSKSPNRFAYLLSLGIVLWTTIQAIINIGVATAALPTKGIALPLVSSGGTGLVLTAAALGLLMSVGVRSPELSPESVSVSTPNAGPLPVSTSVPLESAV
jgi:cell division protein FtsW